MEFKEQQLQEKKQQEKQEKAVKLFAEKHIKIDNENLLKKAIIIIEGTPYNKIKFKVGPKFLDLKKCYEQLQKTGEINMLLAAHVLNTLENDIKEPEEEYVDYVNRMEYLANLQAEYNKIHADGIRQIEATTGKGMMQVAK